MSDLLQMDNQSCWLRALAAIPGGVNSATRKIGIPLVIKEAQGAYITDVEGNRYLDFHAAFGANLLGYAHPEVVDAVQQTLSHTSLTGIGVSTLEIECAELLNSVIPSAEKSILTSSGSEATFQAIRLARGVTNRQYIVKFQGCFHGWHDAVARNVISSKENAYKCDPISTGILPINLESTLIAEFNDLSSVEKLFAEYRGAIAAVIVEPVPHNVGTLLPKIEFLQGLRNLTREEGSLLIFDEVISGFRHALGGYQEICQVLPDLTSYGKAMGNGFPIAGLSGRADLMDQFSSAAGKVLLAGTFNGNPATVAAAIATIKHLQQGDHYRRVYHLGDMMRDGLSEITSKLGIDAVVTGLGSVVICYFMKGPVEGYRDLLRHNNQAYADFHRRMLENKILMLPMALKRNHISGMHSAADIRASLDTAADILAGMQEDGYFNE